LQAGGHRFDPGQLHQKLIRCFQIAAIKVTSIWKQAALSSDGRGRFQQPQGWPASAKDAGFDV
jgi:hypothetical protein